MGMGFPVTGRALAHGIKCGLGCDIVSLEAGDVLTQARIALQAQRAIDNQQRIERGQVVDSLTLSARDALELATIGGASALGLDSEIGTLTPGKAADLIVIRTDGLNHAPPADPVAAVLLHARTTDIDTVVVGGRVVKRDGRLLANVGAARRLIEDSRGRVVGAAEAKGGLLLDLPEGWFEGVFAAAAANVEGRPP
jgi:cytosine/adenosine deaminase-related metal-dependent hydrolase